MCPDQMATACENLLFDDDVLRQVHGDKDPDGFYRGECGGRLGFVPCNMVSEIQVEDEETRQQLLQQGFLTTAASMEKAGESRCYEDHRSRLSTLKQENPSRFSQLSEKI